MAPLTHGSPRPREMPVQARARDLLFAPGALQPFWLQPRVSMGDSTSESSWPDGVEPPDALADVINTQESVRSGVSEDYDPRRGYRSIKGLTVVPDSMVEDESPLPLRRRGNW